MTSISGGSTDDTITGTALADSLDGLAGNDALDGLAGADRLDGGDGNDTLAGGTGSDTLVGGAGDDVYVVDNRDVLVEQEGGGYDSVLVRYGFRLSGNLEQLVLVSGSTAVRGSGNRLANVIDGNERDNRLSGRAGDDTLNGHTGDDTLSGDRGDDVLAGGDGNDTYVFQRSSGRDVVTDAGMAQASTLLFTDTALPVLQLWFSRAGDDLVVDMLGRPGGVTVQNFFSNVDHGWQLQLANGTSLDRAQLTALQEFMSAYAPPATGAVIPASGAYAALHQRVMDVVAGAPLDISLTGDVVVENAAAGTLVGMLASSDPDAGDSATYRLLDDADGRFVLDGNAVRVAPGAALDYESATSHEIRVSVTDGAGLSHQETLAIAVQDLAEKLVAVGGESLASLTPYRHEGTLAAAALEDGGYVAAWEVTSNVTINTVDIVLQRWAADGSLLGGEVLLHTDGASQRNARIVALEDGGFAVGWIRSGSSVCVRRFDADGNVIAGGDRVLASTTATIKDLALHAVGGEVVVAWATSSGEMRRAVLESDGDLQTFAPLHAGSPNINGISIQSLPDGGYRILWRQDSTQQWSAQRLSDEHQAEGASQVLPATFGAADVATLADGTLVFTDLQAASSGYNLLVRGVDASGATPVTRWTTDSIFVPNAYGGAAVHDPSLLPLADGSFLLITPQLEQPPPHGITVKNYDLVAQRFGQDGRALGDAFYVNAFSNKNETYAEILVHANGDAVVLWEEDAGDRLVAQHFRIGENLAARDLALSQTQVLEHSGLVGELTVNDPDGGELVYRLTTNPGGIFGIEGNRLLVLDRDAFENTSGPDIFRVHVTASDRFGWLQTEASFDIQATGTLDRLLPAGTEQAIAPPFGASAKDSLTNVLALEDGHWLSLWRTYGVDAAKTDGVHAQLYAADGTALGSAFQVNTVAAYNQFAPVAAALADGGFVVCWASQNQDGSATGVYGQRFDSDGQRVGTEFRVNTWTQYAQEAPAVSALDNGGFVVAWQSAGQDKSQWGVYAQRFNADGSMAGNEFRVANSTLGDQAAPRVCELGDGGFAVLWSVDGAIMARRFDANGVAAGNEFKVLGRPPDGQGIGLGDVAALEGGGLAVAWRQGSDNWLQVLDAQGLPVNVASKQMEGFPTFLRLGAMELDALPDGGFLLSQRYDGSAFRAPGDTGVYYSGHRFEVQRFDANGVALDAPFTSADPGDRNWLLGTLVQSDGSVLVGRREYDGDYPSGEFWQRYEFENAVPGSAYYDGGAMDVALQTPGSEGLEPG